MKKSSLYSTFLGLRVLRYVLYCTYNTYEEFSNEAWYLSSILFLFLTKYKLLSPFLPFFFWYFLPSVAHFFILCRLFILPTHTHIISISIRQINRFEQLCINYANEKLQQRFTEDVFKAVQAEYQAEGIRWELIHYEDNADVLELLEGRLGILDLLNEEVESRSRVLFQCIFTNLFDDDCREPVFVSVTVQLHVTVHISMHAYVPWKRFKGAWLPYPLISWRQMCVCAIVRLYRRLLVLFRYSLIICRRLECVSRYVILLSVTLFTHHISFFLSFLPSFFFSFFLFLTLSHSIEFIT